MGLPVADPVQSDWRQYILRKYEKRGKKREDTVLLSENL